MKKEERQRAEKFLLQRIFEEDPDFVDRTMEAFSVARSTVYNYINALQERGELERVGGSMPYRIVYRTTRLTIDTSREHSENRVFRRDLEPLFADLPENLRTVWRYAVTAMLNNAFEHAHASAIVCVVNRSRLCTIVGILDNGVGIFRKIQQDVKSSTGETLTLQEAAALLYPGKYTDDPGNHAGQGIFFTSRLMDRFAIRSGTQLFTIHAADADSDGERFRGTAVQMALSNDSSRELSALTDHFLDPENGFNRTSIPIANFFGGAPLSRSEARELEKALSGFASAELDFSDVEEIGPEFAHELFSAMPRRHPELSLFPLNACPSVEERIRQAQNM